MGVWLVRAQEAFVLEPGETAACASATVRPAKPPGLRRSSARPRRSRRSRGRSWRRPISKSLGSCPGVTFSAPVPNSRLDVVVGDDRQPAADERQDRVLPDRARSARHRDGPRRRCRRASSPAARSRPTISPSRRRAGRRSSTACRSLALLDLEVGDRRAAARVPVDEVVVAVDVAASREPTNTQARPRRTPGRA